MFSEGCGTTVCAAVLWFSSYTGLKMSFKLYSIMTHVIAIKLVRVNSCQCVCIYAKWLKSLS